MPMSALNVLCVQLTRDLFAIAKFLLTFKIAYDRHIGKCWKCCNSHSSGPICTKLEWSHPIMSPTCPV